MSVFSKPETTIIFTKSESNYSDDDDAEIENDDLPICPKYKVIVDGLAVQIFKYMNSTDEFELKPSVFIKKAISVDKKNTIITQVDDNIHNDNGLDETIGINYKFIIQYKDIGGKLCTLKVDSSGMNIIPQ